MAVRKPLVAINGFPSVLPVGDTLEGVSNNEVVSGSQQLLYDASGQVSSVVYSNGKTRTIARLPNNLILSVITTGGGQTVTETFTHLANGNIDTTTTVVT